MQDGQGPLSDPGHNIFLMSGLIHVRTNESDDQRDETVLWLTSYGSLGGAINYSLINILANYSFPRIIFEVTRTANHTAAKT